MTISQNSLRRGSWMPLLFIAVACILAPSSLLAQDSSPGPDPDPNTQSGANIDICNYWEADWGNSVEEMICISGDINGLDAYSEVDQALEWYTGYPDWPDEGGDPYVVGLGAEGTISGSDGSYYDTGMAYGGLDPYSPPSVTSNDVSISVTPNAWYSMDGLYSECYDSTGTGSTNCSWNGANDSGMWLYVQIPGTPSQTPTLSMTTSGTPTTYGQPVTFTAAISNGPTGSLTFYDGNTAIGAGTLDCCYNGDLGATLTTYGLAPGNHSITAAWGGNQFYNPATSNAVTQTVNQAPNLVYSYFITPPGGSSGYSYNENILNYADSVNGAWSFVNLDGTSGYDSLNRLVSAAATSGYYQGLTINWSYDNFGNRTGESLGGTSGLSLPTSSSASYNGSNQVTSSSLMGGGPLGYDPSGNVNLDNTNQYLYDGDGHVCAVRNLYSGSLTGYIYDAEGNRVAKGTLTSLSCDMTQNGFQQSSWSVIGQNGEPLTETDGQGNWSHTNVFANKELIATYDQAGLHFQLSDWQGTRRVETDYAGNAQLTCTNLPFGNGASACVTPAEQFFTGQERDTESGNDAFPARYYASNLGGWLTPDPYDGSYDINNPQTFNRYAYVNGNPLAFTDPTGLAGAGILPGSSGSLCTAAGLKLPGSINPCSPVVSATALGIGTMLGFQQYSFAYNSVAPILSFAITFGCGFGSSNDAKSTFCGQSGWTSLISKDHPDLATGINDGVAAVGLADGLAIASDAAASVPSMSSGAYLMSCFGGGPANPVCDVAIALIVYTLANDIFSLFWDIWGHPAQFHGSMQPRPGVPGMQGNSSFGVPIQNLRIPGLPGSSSQNNAQSFGFRTSN